MNQNYKEVKTVFPIPHLEIKEIKWFIACRQGWIQDLSEGGARFIWKQKNSDL